MSHLSRRQLLQTAATLALAGIPRSAWALQTGEEVVDFADLDQFRTEIRPQAPRVRAFDLRRLTSLNTPDEEFFTFHQTETVKDIPAAWKLQVAGFVERPKQFTLDELKARADKRDIAFTLECSGNAPGPAANGLVSNGVWTGCGLAGVLRECGLKAEAREVAFLGMDIELERNQFPTPHGRSVHVQDALNPDAILAYALNGKPLSPERGFPLRVIIPGWYGMTNIKWLERIEVFDRRYEGTHMSRNYHSVYTLEGANPAQELFVETSISRNRMKSVIARVTRRKQGDGFVYRISGAAWGGTNPIKSVEVRIGEEEWQPAKIDQRGDGNYSWLLWSMEWPDPDPGPYSIISRAVDAEGNVQPTLPELRETLKTTREDNSQWPRRIVIRD